MDDVYKTIAKPCGEAVYKEKGSKFLGYAFPVTNEEQIKEYLETIKKNHHSARHWCYAWQLGVSGGMHYRANDDGEPNNSAGMPIYGQIQSFEVTNILIVVVRYFGGVKLGVGGLIQAYKTTAQIALEQSEIIEKQLTDVLVVTFDYKYMNKVMRVVKERNLNVINQKLEMNCRLLLKSAKAKPKVCFPFLKICTK